MVMLLLLSSVEKPFIEMEKQWVKVLEVNVGEQTARIPVKYLAYPEPNVRWYGDHVIRV